MKIQIFPVILGLTIAGAFWLWHRVVTGARGGDLLGGLPLGTRVKDFELPVLSGGTKRLSGWRGHRLLLIFFNPSCESCRDMIPDLGALPGDQPLPVIVSTGGEHLNRRIFGHGRVAHPVLLQVREEVATRCRVNGTPAGYLLSENGSTASGLLMGIVALLSAAGQPPGSREGPAPPRIRRTGNGKELTVRGASEHNLKSIDVTFPMGSLVAIAGEKATGKSTLIYEVLYKALLQRLLDPSIRPGKHDRLEGVEHVHRVIYFDSSPVDPEATPATYMGIHDAISDRQFQGRSLAEVLDLFVEEAIPFFAAEPNVRQPIELLADLGLGRVMLGHPVAMLTGTEVQRMKIAAELGRSEGAPPTVYILDEPTLQLHPAKIGKLLGALHRLVNAGHTVLLIEHRLPSILSADWVIDLGRTGGPKGGRVIAAGTPEQVLAHPESYTAMLWEMAGHPAGTGNPVPE